MSNAIERSIGMGIPPLTNSFHSEEHLRACMDYVPDRTKRAKMSKSSGTAVSVDNVVRAVSTVAAGFYFAAPVQVGSKILLKPIPCPSLNMWRGADGQYRSGPPYGDYPLFLMRDGIDVPCWFSDIEEYQHPYHPYWND